VLCGDKNRSLLPDFTSIAHAVRVVPDGSTISVHDGDYVEAAPIVITSRLNLRSASHAAVATVSRKLSFDLAGSGDALSFEDPVESAADADDVSLAGVPPTLGGLLAVGGGMGGGGAFGWLDANGDEEGDGDSHDAGGAGEQIDAAHEQADGPAASSHSTAAQAHGEGATQSNDSPQVSGGAAAAVQSTSEAGVPVAVPRTPSTIGRKKGMPETKVTVRMFAQGDARKDPLLVVSAPMAAVHVTGITFLHLRREPGPARGSVSEGEDEQAQEGVGSGGDALGEAVAGAGAAQASGTADDPTTTTGAASDAEDGHLSSGSASKSVHEEDERVSSGAIGCEAKRPSAGAAAQDAPSASPPPPPQQQQQQQGSSPTPVDGRGTSPRGHEGGAKDLNGGGPEKPCARTDPTTCPCVNIPEGRRVGKGIGDGRLASGSGAEDGEEDVRAGRGDLGAGAAEDAGVGDSAEIHGTTTSGESVGSVGVGHDGTGGEGGGEDEEGEVAGAGHASWESLSEAEGVEEHGWRCVEVLRGVLEMSHCVVRSEEGNGVVVRHSGAALFSVRRVKTVRAAGPAR